MPANTVRPRRDEPEPTDSREPLRGHSRRGWRNERLHGYGLRVVAVYEIYAGVVGLWRALHPRVSINETSLSFNVFAVLLCLVSIVLGLLLWNGVRTSRASSFVFQLLQVPRLIAGQFQAGLLVGTELSLIFRGPTVALWTTTGVSAVLGTAPPETAELIALNLVAATMAAVSGIDWRRRIADENLR